MDEYCVKAFRKAKFGLGLPELMHSKGGYEAVAKVLREELAEDQIEDVFQVGERILNAAYVRSVTVLNFIRSLIQVLAYLLYRVTHLFGENLPLT